MACCLTALSHWLNQCWLIINEVQWHSYSGNFTRNASTVNHQNLFENYKSKISLKFPRGQWVEALWTSRCELLPCGNLLRLCDKDAIGQFPTAILSPVPHISCWYQASKWRYNLIQETLLGWWGLKLRDSKHVVTHWGLVKMHDILADVIFRCISCIRRAAIWLILHCYLFPGV